MVDAFGKIAAEGRKYGLFLILLTQRPDKINASVLLECHNFAIMKIGSESMLEQLKDIMGLPTTAGLKKCLNYPPGFVQLYGKWKKPLTEVYSFSRRTVEGGRNLQAKHWALPFS